MLKSRMRLFFCCVLTTLTFPCLSATVLAQEAEKPAAEALEANEVASEAAEIDAEARNLLELLRQNAQQPAVPATLEEAKTLEEVLLWYGTKQQEIQMKVLGTGNVDGDAIAAMYAEIVTNGIAAAEKAKTLATTDEEKIRAAVMMIEVLGILEHTELMPLMQQKQTEILESFGTDAEMTEATQKKFETEILKALVEIQQKETEYDKKMQALIAEMEKEPAVFEPIILAVKYDQYMKKTVYALLAEPTAEKFAAFQKEMFDWAGKRFDPMSAPRPLDALLGLSSESQLTELDPNLSQNTVEAIKTFLNAENCPVDATTKEYILKRIEGEAKRKVGADLELYGKTLDDKDFDWKSLRGKIVLVKFTASWCVRCHEKRPGLLATYEKYKDKDFEVVFVYVQDSLEASKQDVADTKLPWVTLSEVLTEKAGQPGQSEAYFIEMLPTAVLVDKDGKVVVGDDDEAIQKKLVEIFGE